jgi:hypothetical protein
MRFYLREGGLPISGRQDSGDSRPPHKSQDPRGVSHDPARTRIEDGGKSSQFHLDDREPQEHFELAHAAALASAL